MALVPLVDESDFAEEDRPTLDQARPGYGMTLHTWQALANVPGLYAAYMPFVRKVAAPGALDGVTKDLCALRVAALNHCRYTLSHRWTSGIGKSIEPDVLAAVAAGDYDGVDDRTRIALRLTEALTLLPATTPEAVSVAGVPEDLRAAAAVAFSPAELVELTLGIGLWNALTRFHRVMGFELDLPAAPEDVAALL
jgi:alkylhydroperoxidase family enzyme